LGNERKPALQYLDRQNRARAARAGARAQVLQPGRNCLRIAPSRRAAVLVDASEYYARLDQALRCARRSILIVGWDFDDRIRLRPDQGDSRPLGDFLRSLAEAQPELDVRILVWSAAVIHAAGNAKTLLAGAPWLQHPRIALRLDQQHPLYASHHQKLVVIDDVIAFVGGIDLTVERWDTCRHSDGDPLRRGPDGSSYGPVHDVQMVVEGEAARVVGDVARERWRVATGERLEPPDSQSELWASDLMPDFTDTAVAVSRTMPPWKGAPAVQEIAALTEDLLVAARKSIYIETQYFAGRTARRLLEKSLAAHHGPEIVVVVRRASPGILERLVMGRNRDRLIRHLRQADRHNRLRVYYPVVPGNGGSCEVLLHSKVLVIDDEILRVGSSNFNNRSMGLDTECDLTIEASNEAQRRGIAGVRDRLLSEHLGVTPDAVAQAVAERGSLIRGIEACNRNGRGLRPFPETDFDGPTAPVLGTGVLDPRQPVKLL
jgi:phosphatidylserine/phosphatidylglycerophosphate/cardiolipin synthase-like enzyme